MYQKQSSADIDKCAVVMERLLNEQWGVMADGDLDIGDFRGDGGASEFSRYACISHDFDSESWDNMLAHVQENGTTLAEALAEGDV